MSFKYRPAGVCVAVLMTAAVMAASAGAAVPVPTSQVLNTSKQVTTIASKTEKLATADAATVAALCGSAPSSPVFARWGDPALYALAPQGDLASTSGWSLSGTTISADHDPYSGSQRSLQLGGAGAAATPAVCIDATKPTIRFFARNTGAFASALRVDVLYEDAKGRIHNLTVARLYSGAGWTPTIPVPIAFDAVAATITGGNVVVSFRFAVEGAAGNWRIDGIYVDPWRCR